MEIREQGVLHMLYNLGYNYCSQHPKKEKTNKNTHLSLKVYKELAMHIPTWAPDLVSATTGYAPEAHAGAPPRACLWSCLCQSYRLNYVLSELVAWSPNPQCPRM